MKAAVFNGIKNITIEDYAKPVIGPDDYLVKVSSGNLRFGFAYIFTWTCKNHTSYSFRT